MKPYNPLDHSIVQATVGAWSQYECDDFVEALFDKVLEEIKRVHWNVFQHTWGPSWHADSVEDPEIPGISFVRYYQDRCDCGGLEPKCQPDCRAVLEHHDWNTARLKWAEVPRSQKEITKEQKAGIFGTPIDFAKLASGEYPVPHPPCTCGAAVNWEEHACSPECIGQRPNFKHEDVEIRWYKYPGRGMSTNKDWNAEEWKQWLRRCLATVRAFEGDLSDYRRHDALREDFNRRHGLKA